MRVTKTIREYVCRRVNEYKNKPSPVEIEYAERTEAAKKAGEELDTQIENYAKALIENYNTRYQLKGDEAFQYNKWYAPVMIPDVYNSELGISARAAKKERKDRINYAVEEILVSLELGATKTDLEKMLCKLAN